MDQNRRYFRYFTYIQPALRSPIIRTYGYAIFTIIMTSIFIIFAIKPTVETIVVLQKQQADQTFTLKALTQKTQDLAQARLNFQAIPDDKKIELQTTLPKSLAIANLIQSLEQSALANQASISALQFQPISIDITSNTQQLQEIPFTFNIEGSYDTLKTVLSSLNNNTRIINITGLIFNRVEGGNTILMSVEGKAFYTK